jgi:membrane fusion protein (multidrug efflux system)
MSATIFDAGVSAPVRSNKKLIIRIVVVLVVLAALMLLMQWWHNGRFIEHTDDAYVGADTTVMSARVPAYITDVLVKDNQQVHAGDVLVRLEDRDYRAALAKAESAIAAQQATLINLEATRQLQLAVIAQARAGVDASNAETQRAKEDQTRYDNLALKAAVSKQSEERATAEYKEALALGHKADATVDAAQRQLAVIDSQKLQVKAALDAASAERDIALLNLEYTVVKAPVDATVGNRHARVGAYASTGQQLLALVPAHGLWIDANFKEDQLARMRAGDLATVKADALPGHEFHGTLLSLAPATGAQFSVLPAENATGNFTKIVQRVPVRIELHGSDADFGALRPGLSVEVSVDTRDSSTSSSSSSSSSRSSSSRSSSKSASNAP